MSAVDEQVGYESAGVVHLTDEEMQANLDLLFVRSNARGLQKACHDAAFKAGWWTNLRTGEPLPVDVPQKLMLTVSELSEAMEGHRKALMDDKLPHRKMVEVELADAAIRIFDLAGAMGLDIGAAMAEKMAFNATRADHKPEARLAAGGKAY